MSTLAELLAAHCRPLLSHAAMPAGQVAAQPALLPEWRLQDGAICRMCRFADCFDTIAFVNARARVFHREDHHPDLLVGHKRCEVRFSTQSVGGISENDFICAAKADTIFGQRCGDGGA